MKAITPSGTSNYVYDAQGQLAAEYGVAAAHGVTYKNECDPSQGFEYKAVDGYMKKIPGDVNFIVDYHARKKSGNCNIQFKPLSN